MSRLTCRLSGVAYVVDSDTLAPTRSTTRDGDVSGPEGRVPSAGLRVGGQRERVVGRPQDAWVFVRMAVIPVVGPIAGWLAGIGRPSSERTLLGLATANRTSPPP
jgi:hypothetical protein